MAQQRATQVRSEQCSRQNDTHSFGWCQKCKSTHADSFGSAWRQDENIQTTITPVGVFVSPLQAYSPGKQRAAGAGSPGRHDRGHLTRRDPNLPSELISPRTHPNLRREPLAERINVRSTPRRGSGRPDSDSEMPLSHTTKSRHMANPLYCGYRAGYSETTEVDDDVPSTGHRHECSQEVPLYCITAENTKTLAPLVSRMKAGY